MPRQAQDKDKAIVKTRSDDSFRLNVKTALPRQAQDTNRRILAKADIRRG
eukprot:COSAG06_NODE_56210_length_286_cov_0.411765_1_plen_49_part_01